MTDEPIEQGDVGVDPASEGRDPDHLPDTQKTRAVYHARFCRRLAQTMLLALTESDMSFADISACIGVPERSIRAYFLRLVEGTGKSYISEFANVISACGFYADVRLTARQPIVRDAAGAGDKASSDE